MSPSNCLNFGQVGRVKMDSSSLIHDTTLVETTFPKGQLRRDEAHQVSTSTSFASLIASPKDETAGVTDFRDDRETQFTFEENEVEEESSEWNDADVPDKSETSSLLRGRTRYETRELVQRLGDDALRLRRTCQWLEGIITEERKALNFENAKLMMEKGNLQVEIEILQEDNAFLTDKEEVLRATILELNMKRIFKANRIKILEENAFLSDSR